MHSVPSARNHVFCPPTVLRCTGHTETLFCPCERLSGGVCDTLTPFVCLCVMGAVFVWWGWGAVVCLCGGGGGLWCVCVVGVGGCGVFVWWGVVGGCGVFVCVCVCVWGGGGGLCVVEAVVGACMDRAFNQSSLVD